MLAYGAVGPMLFAAMDGFAMGRVWEPGHGLARHRPTSARGRQGMNPLVLATYSA